MDIPPVGEPGPAPPESATAQRAPRLGIQHLLMLMFATAIFMTIMRNTNPWFTDNRLVESNLKVVMRLTSILWSICFGAASTGTVVLIVNGIRNRIGMLQEPGYWLLLIATAGFVSSVVQYAMERLTAALNVSTTLTPLLFGWSASVLVMAVMYTMAATYLNEPRWKWVMAALALIHTLYFTHYVFHFLQRSSRFEFLWGAASRVQQLAEHSDLLVAGWLAVVAILDRSQGQRRDWLHWTGVTVTVAVPLIGTIHSAAYQLLR